MVPPETLLNNRYRILEPVGEGGMATVYRAIDTRLGRTVAIKILHPEFVRDQPFLERFQQEAEFAASLGAHPNIVDIYDIGEDGELRYIVMEFIDGRSLKELIVERAPFDAGDTFAIGQQVASALAFAHSRGLVHRDVKPQNILVTPEGVAKVTDFGIARSATASQLTRTGVVMGTVHYFSPEQAQGKPTGPPTDIYSLGVILYEMLTGHLPFDAENAIGVAMQHIHSEPPSPWEYIPELPVRSVATVMRALEKDPERRYRDASEFAGALGSTAPSDSGATTIYRVMPQAVPQTTAFFQPVEPEPEPAPAQPRRTVAVEPAARSVAVAAPRNPWRVTLLALLGLALAAAVAAGAFFATNHFAGGAGAPPTSTPRPTATAKPKHHHRKPTAAPTVAVIIPPPQPTSTPTPPPPTFTPTPEPPTPTRIPTSKPKPKPTATPTPPPATPTPTLQPIIITPIGPVPTDTATG